MSEPFSVEELELLRSIGPYRTPYNARWFATLEQVLCAGWFAFGLLQGCGE